MRRTWQAVVWSAAACAGLVAGPVQAQEGAPEATTFAQLVERVRARPEFAHSSFGIAVRDVESDEVLYELDANEYFTPASTTKLVTEGAVFALLGADHRFRTRVYRTGPVDDAGILRGDLVLVASGDPNLSGRLRGDGTLAFTNHDHAYGGSPDTEAVEGDPLLVIDRLAAGVAGSRIRRIHGHVVVDVSLFDEGEPELGSGVIISPLSLNDNVIDLTIGPGAAVGDTSVLSISPPTGYVRFRNGLTTGGPESERETWWTNHRRADGSYEVELTGNVPAGSQPVLWAWQVPEPSRFGEFVLAERLQARGVVASPRPADREIDFESLEGYYDEAHQVAEHISAPLSEEIKVTLKVSQNLHASMVPYLLGAVLGPDSVSPLDAGFGAERSFLADSASLDITGASLGDGAGGHRINYFTPAFMTSFLDYMAERPDFPLYRAALPVLGRDGSLARIQPDSPAAGQVQAKTGTYILWNALGGRWMLTAKALAGYTTSVDGRTLAFALFLNRMPYEGAPSAAAELAGQALGELAAGLHMLPVSYTRD